MNIRDIARLANVTPGTVSKVLNNYPDISEATRQHVLQIIKENQYTTKNGGRKFKQAVTPRIGLVSENVYNWVSETMQNLLSVRFHNADYTVLSFQDNYFSQNKNEKFQELLTYIDRHQLTGLIDVYKRQSKMTNGAFLYSALAIATFCASPPDGVTPSPFS